MKFSLRKVKKKSVFRKMKKRPLVEEQKIAQVVEKEEQILEENILGRQIKKKGIGLQKKVEIQVKKKRKYCLVQEQWN